MGGSSTSHGAVLRDRKDDKSSGFNLHSWQGLTQVLKLGKESLRNAGAYAEFRNLVLQYAQQGGDVELRKKIDALVATFGNSSVRNVQKQDASGSKTTPVVSEQVADIAVSELKNEENVRKEVERISHIVAKSSHEALNIPTELAVSNKGITKVSIFGARRAQPQFNKNPTPVVQHIHHEAVTAEIPKPDTKVVVNIAPDAPQVVEVPLPPVPVTETRTDTPPMISSSGTMSLDAYRTRITEIKRNVREHVGNPATLIDTHNVLGKKYMTALLSALKATGGGSALNVDTEMQKLEEVAKALLAESENMKDEMPEVAQSVQVPTHDEKTAEEKVIPEVKQSIPIIPSVPLLSVVPVPLRNVEPEKRSSSATSMKVTMATPLSIPKPVYQTTPPQASVARNVPQPIPPATGNTTSRGYVSSAHDIKEKSNPVTTDSALRQTDLMTPENTEALHQLLDEWSIFGGSGFFGIGPGGVEHPLYIQLAPLSMGEVVAGRWEKADPKITKIIKQYVDAWRHEQGIAYTINETFEHYLRRVVQRILKRKQAGI